MKQQTSKQQVHYFRAEDPLASFSFATVLQKMIHKLHKKNQAIVLLCIGTDRATGDCLGPLLGYKIKMRTNTFPVYGDLNEPVHAKNLSSVLAEIHRKFNNPFIIAIDASLGEANHVGCFTLASGPLFPGAGVNKTLPSVGHLSITGIVDSAGDSPMVQLQNTRLRLVMALADSIFTGLCHGLPSPDNISTETAFSVSQRSTTFQCT